MKRLIIVALLSSVLVGWGTSAEEHQINANKTYEYFNVHTGSSESYTSETNLEFSDEQHTRGIVEENRLSKVELEPIDKTVFMYRLFMVAMIVMIVSTLLLNFIMNTL